MSEIASARKTPIAIGGPVVRNRPTWARPRLAVARTTVNADPMITADTRAEATRAASRGSTPRRRSSWYRLIRKIA